MKAAINKIDRITALLLFFIFFLGALFVYLIKIDSNINEHSLYHDKVMDIKLIDKSFDNFLSDKSTFINYDDINMKIADFEKKIKFLDSQYSHKLFNKNYSSIVSNLKISFEKKQNLIENFKSNSASLLNSIHYLFDLNRAIQKDISLSDTIKKLVTEETLLLMKYYINSYSDKKKIQDNLSLLKQKLKDSNCIELELFIMHTSRNIKRIENYNIIEDTIYEKQSLSSAINQLNTFLNKEYKENSMIEKIIAILFFIIALIILFVLLVMHKRSQVVKNELLGFKTAVENSDNSIVITNSDKNITYVNDVFLKETGYKMQEVLGKNPRVLKSGHMSQSIYDELNKTIDSGKKWEGEFINIRKDKSLYYEKASITPIYINNEIKQYLAIKLNITNYIEQKKELEFLALHDTLTALPNRTSIEMAIEKKMKLAKRNKSELTLLFVDLDRFKIINDTLGHDVGDELLIKTAKRLKDALRESDIVARIGGDEFLIVLDTHEDEYHAGKVCEKIITLFSEPIETKEHKLKITLSIGVAIYPDDGLDYQTLLKHADIAMYQAKSAGKNTFKYYQKQLSVDVQNRLNIEQAFSRAMQNSEFYMVYQPKYTLRDKKIVGLEALVRWNSSSLKSITPDIFIPVAEDTGFILELGLFIFKQACIDFLIFKQYSTDLKRVSINVSAVQLYQETFMEDIVFIMDEIGINAKSIVLEITETYIMKNIEHSIKVLNALQEIGFSISIDDFGTGHSSLSYLKKFPINELKIDKSFVDGVLDDQNDIAITKVIIGLSKSLDYINVAEGIENKEQEQFLIDNSCLLGQGFYFCKPKCKDDLIKFIQG